MANITLKDYLAGLPADPTDPLSPPLRVADGDLSKADREVIESEAYGNRPYAILLGVVDAPVARYDDGSARMLTPMDVILEMRPPSSKAVLTSLWLRAFNAPKKVNELLPGVPLATRLVYAAGTRPHALSDQSEWLQATLRYETNWHSPY